MDQSDVRQWFAEYLDAYSACGRGEREVASLLSYYAVPLLVATDAGFVALTTEDQVAAAVQQPIQQLRSLKFHRNKALSSEVTILNSKSALYTMTLLRERHDGTEIGRQTFTDLLTDGSGGRRISALALHSS